MEIRFLRKILRVLKRIPVEGMGFVVRDIKKKLILQIEVQLVKTMEQIEPKMESQQSLSQYYWRLRMRQLVWLMSWMVGTRPIFWLGDEQRYSRSLQLLDRMGCSDLIHVTQSQAYIGKLFHSIISPSIENLGDFEKTLANAVKEHPGQYYLFDMSMEPFLFEDYTSQKLVDFHRMLDKNNVNGNQVWFLCATPKASSLYQSWATKNRIKNKINMLGLNFYLYEYFWEVSSSDWFQQNYYSWFEASRPHTELRQSRKKFSTFNLRPKFHRTALVLHLMDRGWLDQGIVTYGGDHFGHSDTEAVEAQRENLKRIKALPAGKRLTKHWEELNHRSPLAYERSEQDLRRDLWQRQPGQVDFLVPEIEMGLTSPASYFEIVTETWFPNEQNPFITEKILRPFLRFQPFVLLGSAGTLELLHEKGFKTFHPWIDETYDGVSDSHQRMELIFKEIDRLCSKTPDELESWYQELWPNLQQNYFHFLTNMCVELRAELEEDVIAKLPRSSFLQEMYLKRCYERHALRVIPNAFKSFWRAPRGPYFDFSRGHSQ